MAETADFRYRAFLSYAHADSAWAKWLHKRLEGFRIDKDLVGRATKLGPVPPALRPIFRDREDFSGGHALTDATIAALDQSAALIVLCSPVSAIRPAVDEEARLFRSRHPDRPVIPVVIGGSYPENFPPALRYELATDGTVTDRPVTLLGPDLRETGDGRELGLAKVVAGLTGLSPDDIYRRAERARRRQTRFRAAIAAAFLVIVVGGGFFAWQNLQKQQTLAEIEALVARYGPVGEAQSAAPGAGQGLKEAITAIAQGAASDPRYREALELLKAGKPKEAEPLLAAVAEDKKKQARQNAKEAAAAYRNLAAIKEVSDPRSAREAYAEAATLDPEYVEGLFWHGWSQKEAGNLARAETAFRSLLAIAKVGADDDWVYWARLGLGDIQVSRGDLGIAVTTYREASAVAERLVTADPGNVVWQRDLGVSHTKIGDVLVAQGNLPEALESYRASFAIAERLAKADPGNAGRQFDLGISHERIGEIMVAQGNLAGALESYEAKQAIISRLAKADPDNAGWQRDLWVSHNKVGEVLLAQGNLAAALSDHEIARAIANRLVTMDPQNSGWERDLTISHNLVGDVLRAQGNLPAALESYGASLAIRNRLAKADPGNAGWQRDLSVSHNKIGNVLRAQGNLAEALESYKADLSIAERLAKADPGNARWQHDLALSLRNVGLVASQQGQQENALEAYRRGLEIMRRLTALAPDHAAFKRDLAWFEAQLSQR